MKLSRFIIILLTITLLTVLYVRIQIEIITLGYKVQQREAQLLYLLDQNRILRYNIEALKAPKNLESKLFGKKNYTFQIVAASNIVYVESPSYKGGLIQETTNKKLPNLLFSLFNLAKPAQAQDLR